MATKARRTERRAEALSKERIIATAIDILDADGACALTFRTLAARLETGSGALYWHVADKDELLAATADHVVARAMAEIPEGTAHPRGAIRAIALGVFDAIDAHPWAGAQLTREPWRPGALQFFEGIGDGLVALGVPERLQFDAWSALVNYILGVAGQNAAQARRRPGAPARSAFLAKVAAHWESLDPATHPFLRRLSARLLDHDDRKQFLAGIDLILAGFEAGR